VLAQTHRSGTCWPCAPALSCLNLLCHSNLLLARSLVGLRSVLATAISLPGLRIKLQATGIAVASVDAPVTCGLTLSQFIPHGSVSPCWCAGSGSARRAFLSAARDGSWPRFSQDVFRDNFLGLFLAVDDDLLDGALALAWHPLFDNALFALF